MMARKRRYILLIAPVAIALVIGLVVNAEMFPADYSYQKGLFGPHNVQAELLPANSHIRGQIIAKNPFSAYVVVSKSGYFEDVNGDNVVLSWENVTEVDLDFNVSSGNYYLVIKNGNVSQEIEMRFKADG